MRASRVRLAGAAAALLAASACSRSTTCRVENASRVPVTHVVVSGAGFSVPVPDLAPGASATVPVRPRGEAGRIDVVFVAGGSDHRHVENVYFEKNGYSLVARIGPDFAVTVEAGLSLKGGPP